MNVPTNMSFMQLKVLNLNRNQELSHFTFGYCPIMEILSLSYCSFIMVKSLIGCPNLREFDVSFNNIQNLEGFLNIVKDNHEIRIIRCNDNPFYRDTSIDPYIKRVLPLVERVNGNAV